MLLGEAIERFLLAMEAGGRADKTLRWYSDILRAFGRWGGELTTHSIVRYLAARRKLVSAATQAGDYRALRRFCHWLYAKRLIATDPITDVDAPLQTETVPRVSGSDVALALVAAADYGRWPQRDRALVMVLADSGARLNEFLAINMDNLRVIHRDGTEHGEAWVIGKGRRRRRLLIGPDSMSELAAWIVERPPQAGSIIWWSERGAPLTPIGVQLILRRLSKRAGIPSVNPHSFRHGAAVDYINAGGDVRTLQLILGHSQIATTAKYLHLADAVVTEAHDKISRARFSDRVPAQVR